MMTLLRFLFIPVMVVFLIAVALISGVSVGMVWITSRLCEFGTFITKAVYGGDDASPQKSDGTDFFL